MKCLFSGVLACAMVLGLIDVQSAFREARIEPDILDVSPTGYIEVNYGLKSVYLGNELVSTDAFNPPEIRYRYEYGALYTLVMTDPDYQDQGGNREWQHWVVGNIPEDRVARGELLTAYNGPTPPRGTHRYVFLLYKQNQGPIVFIERRLSATDYDRGDFSAMNFSAKYNLGAPIAGNFVRVVNNG